MWHIIRKLLKEMGYQPNRLGRGLVMSGRAIKLGMIIDEWGTWYDVEPGTNPGFLYQQNTMRDALVAALTLNIFNSRCDRVKMACIAQMVNVLQAVLLTEGRGQGPLRDGLRLLEGVVGVGLPGEQGPGGPLRAASKRGRCPYKKW